MYTPSSARAGALFREHEKSVYQRTDQMFFYLLLLQWAAAVVVAVVVSPYTWIGASQRVNEHVWIAVLLGGAVVSLPACMARYHAGHAVTRHVIAVGHMLMVGMLVHLSGGRIETHFHYFGSLAFLSFYRDWRILLTATLVAGTEHLLRGIYWPLSIYGVLTASPWRTLEHVWWVLLEDVVLVIAISQNVRAMGQIAERIRKAIEADAMEIAGAVALKLTASIGVAIFPACGDTAEQLFVNADAGLYHAKRNGRNQVCFHAI